MMELTPEEIARLEQLRREGDEFRERWDAKMRRWHEREGRRRRRVRRILCLGLPG